MDRTPDTVPATGDAWANLGLAAKAALICASMFASIGLYSMGVALPALESAFTGTANVSLMVQIVGGIVAPAFALASPLAGRLIGKYGVRSVYLGSITLFVLGGLGPMLVSSLPAMLPFRLVLALGVAGGMTAGYAGIARLPGTQRQVMLGMMSFIGGAIAIVGFPITGALAADSWRLAFLVHLILIPLALFALALPRRDGAVAGTEPHGPPAGKLGGVPVLLLAITVIGGWGIMASSIYSPFYLASIGVTDPAATGKVLSAMAVCSLAGSGSYGFVHRLLGTRGMLLLGLGLGAGGCFVIAMNSAIPGVIAGLGMLGAGLSIFSAAAYATAIETIGPAANVGAAMGIMNLAMFGPQILFPPVATAVGASTGPASVYLALAALFAACVVLVAVRPFRSTVGEGQ